MVIEEYKGFLIHIRYNEPQTETWGSYSVSVIEPKSEEELVDLGEWGSDNDALDVAQNWIDESTELES